MSTWDVNDDYVCTLYPASVETNRGVGGGGSVVFTGRLRWVAAIPGGIKRYGLGVGAKDADCAGSSKRGIETWLHTGAR